MLSSAPVKNARILLQHFILTACPCTAVITFGYLKHVLRVHLSHSVTTGTCSTLCFGCYAAFSVLTLLVERQEGHLACKKTELVS